jgi:glyoxylase-like metal-dependent hydrolase (beta-lactamase superfamily II)
MDIPMPRALLLALLSTLLLAPAMAAVAAAPQVKAQAPGFYRMMLGDDEITVLSDGTFSVGIDKIMSKPDEARQVLASDHETLPLELSINAFLINTGSRLILVDTGEGQASDGAPGRLIGNLRAAGYQPEQIDAILITHMHGDHSGGLSIGGQLAFPNATVYVDKRDSDYWLSPATEAKAPAAMKQTFQQIRALFEPEVKAGKLHPFDGASELFPGVSSVPSYGHTPGHTAYMIESKGQKLLLWGDSMHLAEVQFADPDVTIEYDSDPKAAIASRKKLMAAAAAQGFIVGGAHISFPGLGHIRADGKGYTWIPVPYSAGP